MKKLLFAIPLRSMRNIKSTLEYRSKGIVAENDSYIIAVNGFPLSYRWVDAEMPRILKAVFPLGPLEFVLDRKTAKVEAIRHQFRPMIYKSTSGEVSTEFLVNDRYCGISAILHSYANAWMTVLPFPEGLVAQKNADQLGIDFLIAHNPMALRPAALSRMKSRSYRLPGQATCPLLFYSRNAAKTYSHSLALIQMSR